MSVPQPLTALEGHCSAINNETLYVLGPTGLQSLPLRKGAEWAQEEAGGVNVTGPACVTAIPNGDVTQAAMYVIGGTSSNTSYSGLQRYFFGNSTWETLSVPANVLQDRTNHSAAFLNDTQSILVYAGSQPSAPSDLSSQTFLIDTSPSYYIEAFTSIAPPTNLPILQPWNSTHAVMVGGVQGNTDVFTFGVPEGWNRLGTNLSQSIDSTTLGSIVSGSDGSRVLELYDVGVSPNTVTQIVLLDAGGSDAATGQTVGDGSSSSRTRKRKRAFSLQDWPTYNSSNAPTAVRTDSSIARDSSGMTVISGGNSDSPLALFDQSGGSWVDADSFFDSKNQQPLQASNTDSSTPTSTSSPSSTATSTPKAGLSAHDRTLRTLGITLGVLCGIAAVFIIILLILRYRKLRRRKQEGYINENEKSANRMSFQDRGASFMKEAGGPANELSPPKSQYMAGANGSHSSFAIIAGRLSRRRDDSNHRPKSSYESTTRLVKDKQGNVLAGEPVEMMQFGQQEPDVRRPEPAADPDAAHDREYASGNDRSRSSGWSKYFATSGPTGPNGLSHLPAAYVKPNTASRTTDGSAYSGSNVPSQPSRIPSSALVPPLDIDFSRTIDGQRLSHVTTGSPSFSDSREDLAKFGNKSNAAEGQRGLIVNPRADRESQISGHSLSSYNRTTISSNLTSDYYNESGNTDWTPLSPSFKDHVNDRPPSSVYTASVYEPRAPSRGKTASFFPGPGATYRPKTKTIPSAAPTSDWAAPKGVTNGLEVPKAGEPRESTVTVFPRGVSSSYYTKREEAKTAAGEQPSNSDMSWLNLGLSPGRPKT